MFIKSLSFLLIASFMIMDIPASAQHQGMQYFRQSDKRGLSVFETAKADTTSFHKLNVKVGGNFEQSYQMLRDKNTALPMTAPGFVGNVNSLIPLTNGVRVQLVSYRSSRHHEDTWGKGDIFNSISCFSSTVRWWILS